MYPILFVLFGFTLYTYGLLVATGFAAGIFYLSYQAKKKSPQIISQDDLFNLLFYTIIASIVGARLLYVIAEAPDFINDPLSIFKIWEGGLVYYGGFICATAFALFYLKRKRLNIFRVLDLFAPAIALGHFFGRLGCLMAGCCYGKPTHSHWGIVFTDPNSLALIRNTPLHPTQIYEAALNLILFLILHLYNKRKHKAGLAIAIYMISYAVYRFIIEFFRADFRGTVIGGLSTSQFISVFVFIIGIAILYRVSKNGKVDF